MFDHLRYRAARVEARSPAGRLAEQTLMLNDDESVAYREFVLRIIATLEAKQRQLQETIRKIDQFCMIYPERADELVAEKASTETNLAKLQGDLRRLTGMGPSI